MQDFPQYGGAPSIGEYAGDYSFDSGGGGASRTGDSETELDMITDDGDVDEEVCLTFCLRSLPALSYEHYIGYLEQLMLSQR